MPKKKYVSSVKECFKKHGSLRPQYYSKKYGKTFTKNTITLQGVKFRRIKSKVEKANLKQLKIKAGTWKPHPFFKSALPAVSLPPPVTYASIKDDMDEDNYRKRGRSRSRSVTPIRRESNSILVNPLSNIENLSQLNKENFPKSVQISLAADTLNWKRFRAHARKNKKTRHGEGEAGILKDKSEFKKTQIDKEVVTNYNQLYRHIIPWMQAHPEVNHHIYAFINTYVESPKLAHYIIQNNLLGDYMSDDRELIRRVVKMLLQQDPYYMVQEW